MNPQRIYDQHRDDAMAALITAEKYSTFVAMPFGQRYSYRAKEVYERVIQGAAIRANELRFSKREFDVPRRIDDFGLAAAVITEEIVVRILNSHFFLADLTNENAGVLLETGVALALRPNSQIVLITQDNHSDLHFDIRNNNVISYNPPDGVERIAKALIHCATAFETEANNYLHLVSQVMTPDAIICLNWYWIQQEVRGNKQQSLHAGVAKEIFENINPKPTEIAFETRFIDASRELLTRRLIMTEYKPKGVAAGDTFGMHATALGWAFMRLLWGS